MRIWHRLTAAQVPLFLAIVGVGTISVLQLQRLGESSQRILSENYRSVVAAQRLTEAIERLDSAALAAVAGRRAALDSASDHFRVAEQELQVALGNVTEAGEVETLEHLQDAWRAYSHSLGRLQRADPASIESEYFQHVEPAFTGVKQAARDILALNQEAMVRKSDLARGLADRTVAVLVVASILALVAGAVTSTLLTARILRPLRSLASAAAGIAADDYDARAEVGASDEIAAVASEFNRMAEAIARFRRASLGQIERAQTIAQAAVDCIPDPVLVVATDGQVLIANPAGASIVRHAPERLMQYVHEVRAAVVERETSHTPKSIDEAVVVSVDGAERWYLCRGVPLLGAERLPSGVVLLLSDVTTLKRLGRQQEDSVATVAHELRTPLTSLHMAILLCLEGTPGPVNEEQAKLLAVARQDCERLRATVDDLLDVARLRGGVGREDRRSMSPRELVENAASAAREALGAGERLCVDVDPGLEPVIVEPVRFQVALSNLLTNALRHSPVDAQVTLRAARSGSGVRFEVIDRGPGVPAEWREQIFERFTQVPGRLPGGAGLGLWIAREIVRAHGGRVGVAETPGQGATFWLELPAGELTA